MPCATSIICFQRGARLEHCVGLTSDSPTCPPSYQCRRRSRASSTPVPCYSSRRHSWLKLRSTQPPPPSLLLQGVPLPQVGAALGAVTMAANGATTTTEATLAGTTEATLEDTMATTTRTTTTATTVGAMTGAAIALAIILEIKPATTPMVLPLSAHGSTSTHGMARSWPPSVLGVH